MSRRTIASFLVAAVVAASPACGGGGSDSPASDTQSGGNGATVSARGGATGSGGVQGIAGEANVEASLSDAQICAVLAAINDGLVAEAKMALQRSQNDDVIDFANSVASDHGKASDDLAALVKSKAIAPEDSKTSLTLAASSAVEVDNLGSVAATNFDAAYVSGQVSRHDTIIAVIENMLEGVDDDDLRDVLTSNADMIREHRSEAQSLATAL